MSKWTAYEDKLKVVLRAWNFFETFNFIKLYDTPNIFILMIIEFKKVLSTCYEEISPNH